MHIIEHGTRETTQSKIASLFNKFDTGSGEYGDKRGEEILRDKILDDLSADLTPKKIQKMHIKNISLKIPTA